MAVGDTVLNQFERVVKRSADWNACVEFVRDELNVPMTDVGFYGLVAIAHQFGRDAAREKLAEKKPVGAAAATPSSVAPSKPSAKPPEIPAKKVAPPASNKPDKKPDIKKPAKKQEAASAKAKSKDKKPVKKGGK